MESVSCNVCGRDDSALLYEGRDRMLGGAETFHLVRCRRCGLMYVNPRPGPGEIAAYYPPSYEPFARQEQLTGWYGRLRYRVNIAVMCRIAAGGQKPGRMLDVGCGDGQFLAGMLQRGWEGCGLDISPVAVDLARGKGLDVFLGPLAEAGYEDQSFDLVTMWDVLEHLHDPGDYLARIGRLLKPGGRLVVTLPNPHSLDFRLFGPFWNGLDVPRHLYVFARSALLALLDRAGLEVESARCRYTGQRVSTWSLEWLIDERVAHNGLKRGLKRLIYSPVWYWLWRPFYLAVDLLKVGSNVTYRCRPAGAQGQ